MMRMGGMLRVDMGGWVGGAGCLRRVVGRGWGGRARR